MWHGGVPITSQFVWKSPAASYTRLFDTLFPCRDPPIPNNKIVPTGDAWLSVAQNDFPQVRARFVEAGGLIDASSNEDLLVIELHSSNGAGVEINIELNIVPSI
mmetsp:Transcript_10568/g.19861  ORF Transcript_10568/g.19861 Transcript_10568/m.19861 type:complete len:104 (+) Transcript_10568:1399-1710(+)